jgi:hypothetical protein
MFSAGPGSEPDEPYNRKPWTSEYDTQRQEQRKHRNRRMLFADYLDDEPEEEHCKYEESKSADERRSNANKHKDGWRHSANKIVVFNERRHN